MTNKEKGDTPNLPESVATELLALSERAENALRGIGEMIRLRETRSPSINQMHEWQSMISDLLALVTRQDTPNAGAAESVEAANARAEGVQSGEPIWGKVKPSAPGVYGIRGYQLGVDPVDQFEAVVQVKRNDDDELVCNMHECTTDEELDNWCPVSSISSRFEWCQFVPAAQAVRSEASEGDNDGR